LLLSCSPSDLKNRQDWATSSSIVDGTSSDSSNLEDGFKSWEEDPMFRDADIPNVLNDLDDTACDAIAQDLEGTPGATSYFAGIYLSQNGSWVGREKWILFPNDSWEAIGGYPCEVSWDMEIYEREEPTTCLACDIAFDVEAFVNESDTTCPRDLWDIPSEQNWQTTYEILISSGSSIFYFQSNGEPFGWGYSSERAINFISNPDCKWF